MTHAKYVTLAEEPASKYLCQLMAVYFRQGWCLGTSGGMSLKVSPADAQSHVLAAPSGVPKERLTPEDLFTFTADGATALAGPPHLKPSDSNEVHFAIYQVCGSKCGAVVHTHSRAAALASSLAPQGATKLSIAPNEMVKGLGVSNTNIMELPLIDNMPEEPQLVPAVRAVLAAHPDAVAILVREHGVYAWGATWDAAKRHVECLEYLLDLHVHRAMLGAAVRASARDGLANGVGEDTPVSMRPRIAALPSSSSAVVVLDVEGTTTPISFVKEVLFGYFLKEISDYGAFTQRNAANAAVVAALDAVRVQLVTDGVSSPGADLGIYMKELVRLDRKVPALKQLQGLVWQQGYASGELKGSMFEDVSAAMASWKAQAKQVYIFSSGSRQAQRDIYRYSDKGDLSTHLSGYFEPASVGGHSKRTADAYREIALSLGRDGSDIIFATDVYEEALAAREAGWNAVIVVRPGNAPLPDEARSFTQVTSLLEL